MIGTKIGSLLHEDHMQTIETLQAMEGVLHKRAMPAMDEELRNLLQRLARTMRAEVEKHFGFEEQNLFPIFSSKGEMGIVIMLTHEHRSILPLALEIARLAECALADGFDDGTWQAFRSVGAELVEREIFHIQKEEMGLMAAIASLIDPETDTKLAEAFRLVA